MGDTTPTRPAPTAIRADVVVGLSMDCQLTAAELAALTDDQTRDLFKAIKTVATLTQLARTNVLEASR